MALVGRHKFDTAVPVAVVVPVHKICYPLTGQLLAGEWLARVIGPVFDGPEQ
jgi:hypothetical protein